jgi:hypothetical protein
MRLDLADILTGLADDRPIFHSESDFQYAVAWQIRLRHPQAKVRLEPRPRPGHHLDLLIRLPEWRTAIELKYPRARFRGTVADEFYELSDQAGHDIHRHDVVKDVTRVESLLSAGHADEGYVVTLTNDRNYWLPSARTDTNGEAFRIHEGRILEGTLAWDARAGSGTTKDRNTPLVLVARYKCHWKDYSSVKDDKGKIVQLRYLLLAVQADDALDHADVKGR